MRIITICKAGILLFGLGFCSCSDMNDPHQPYLDKGETIYAARLDSVVVRSGNLRQQLDIYYTAQRIKQCVVYWNMKSDSVSFDLPVGNRFSVIMPNLPEGEYTYNLITYDKYKNKGLPIEFIGRVYGKNYQQSLINMAMVSISKSEEDVVIEWKEAELQEGIKFTYTKANNEVVTVDIPMNEKKTTLLSPKFGSEYSYVTLFRPNKKAIDLFEASPKKGVFPL